MSTAHNLLPYIQTLMDDLGDIPTPEAKAHIFWLSLAVLPETDKLFRDGAIKNAADYLHWWEDDDVEYIEEAKVKPSLRLVVSNG